VATECGQALMDSHIAALQTFVASVESLHIEALDLSTDPEPQKLMSHRFHCYVVTLVKALIPIVIRDIPVSASDPDHLFCLSCMSNRHSIAILLP